MEKLNKAQICSILGPQNPGSRGDPGSAPVFSILHSFDCCYRYSTCNAIFDFNMKSGNGLKPIGLSILTVSAPS